MKDNVIYTGDTAAFQFEFTKSYIDQSINFPLYVSFGEPVKESAL